MGKVTEWIHFIKRSLGCSVEKGLSVTRLKEGKELGSITLEQTRDYCDGIK